MRKGNEQALVERARRGALGGADEGHFGGGEGAEMIAEKSQAAMPLSKLPDSGTESLPLPG